MTATANTIEQYTQRIDEFIFDGNDVLYAVNRLPGTSCDGKYVSELDLPPGNYTVVSWANIGNASHINEAAIGQTRKSDMQLYLDNPYATSSQRYGGPASYAGHNANAEKLFYGYRSFSVNDEGISRICVDMFNSHCVLTLSIRWKSNPPVNTQDFYLLYRQIPATYRFTPHMMLQDKVWSGYGARTEQYPANDYDRVHYSPRRQTEEQLATHRQDVYMNVDKRIETEFITYRYGDDSQLLLSLHAGETQIMKEIDLQHFFRSSSIQLDQNFRQEFQLQVEIDGDKVTVGFMNVNDWEEGGAIGGR